jgi:hypothetical protein
MGANRNSLLRPAFRDQIDRDLTTNRAWRFRKVYETATVQTISR